MQIYLDWNSCGILHPDIANLMTSVAQNYCNTASKHSLGQKSKKFFCDLIKTFLSDLDASEYDIIFTSGATESNKLIADMFNEKLFVSNIEHPSIRDYGQVLNVNHAGELIEMPNAQNFLLSYMLANHETGIINSISTIGEKCRAADGLIHVDMVQAFGRIKISFATLKPDYATISSHKVGGPIGIGALLIKKGLPTPSVIRGTVPLPLIAGMIASLKLPSINNSALELMLPKNIIVGYDQSRLPNTTCIKCTNKTKLMMALDCAGILCSTGAACTSAISDRAHSPFAMGIKEDTLRISSGWQTSESDLIKAGEYLLNAMNS